MSVPKIITKLTHSELSLLFQFVEPDGEKTAMSLLRKDMITPTGDGKMALTRTGEDHIRKILDLPVVPSK